MRLRSILGILLLAIQLLAISSPAFPRSTKVTSDGVALELVGQVINPSAASSIQFGYISYINGLGLDPLESIFSGAPQNETTAMFTFYSDTATMAVINNGSMRIVSRSGTLTIYLNDKPHGDFNNPDTFRGGTPVMVASLRHQVIIDTVTGSFTTTFSLTVTSSETFGLGDTGGLRLGKPLQELRLTAIGHLNSPGPPSAYIAGFVVGGNLITRK